ncbi:MAG TPA: glycosyl hydrolase 53 family protein [Verrucomicrobiae bacterium]|nr:glycosyl hydrolase 53 family protein [Verrucomicrobiae bacterium]
MKQVIVCLSLFLFCLGTAESSRGSDFAFGADLSFLKQQEDHGKVFKDNGQAEPALQIFRDHGYNWIRLRLFVEPVAAGLPNNLAYTLALAQDAKKLGYKFLLDFHYANSWADPAKQPTPEAWIKMSHKERVKAVFEYTRDTIAAFQKAGVLPDMVQIGNEITHGMLWPDGKLPQHWDKFADYVYAGVNGVDAGRGNGKRPKIMIHIDQGGSVRKTKAFFDKFNTYGIPYDVIGLSYYPWWHGSLMDLRANLAFAAKAYGKDIMVVETAYHWRKNNETKGRLMPFPETPEGQREFLDELTRIVMNTPRGLGKGIFWWEPTAGGPLGSRSFFDDKGNALPVITVFDKYTRPLSQSGVK